MNVKGQLMMEVRKERASSPTAIVTALTTAIAATVRMMVMILISFIIGLLREQLYQKI